MEIHRLKPMGEYDVRSFNKLYSKTRSLVRTLARGIDSRRFNVDKEIIESWFDDKFIFVFHKYHNQYNEDVLLGHIINSLKLYKYRILRGAYSKQSEFNQLLFDIGENNDGLENIPDYSDTEYREVLINSMWDYMRSHLDDDAMLIFELECSPPEYITQRLKNPNSRITSKLICEFLDIEIKKENLNYIDYLRKQVSLETERARNHFQALALDF